MIITFILDELMTTILSQLQNQQAGAEEAFKILGHAFELIGEPVSMSCMLMVNIYLFSDSG